ncbi:MAG: NADH-quinone oxidoreductase subunit N [Crenarchaeota archaeon]|nr:NADH-quinone oxidoreductase subunit N [Thermoproteota archaeon]MCR8471193.1 NADH-quinone oxidoreductase subunit N [Thermoproteota archaeon]MCR8472347.1 NADH-quinone oxidoreductase subunit N [Thermoproteota archaeon]MCR8473679.1 NADH-quinone oxidoreductase subunit N [Thermoproteota archaeon]
MTGVIEKLTELINIFTARPALVTTVAILFIATFLCLLIERFSKTKRNILAFVVVLSALLITEAILLISPAEAFDPTKEYFLFDEFAKFFASLGIFATLIVILISQHYIKGLPAIPVFFACMTGTSIGLILLPAATDLITLYVSWELLSVPLYGLVLYAFNWRRSTEGALKYYVMGATSSAFLGLGLAILIAISGKSNIYMLKPALEQALESTFNDILLGLAVLLLVIGFSVKMTIVPFHSWAPDTYTGSAHPVTAYLSGTIKAVRFAALLRIVLMLAPVLRISAQAYFAILAFLTMTYANIVALKQRDIYRMLAYSSISQVGYILMGLVAGTLYGATAAIFYALVFAMAEVLVFSITGIVWKHLNITTIDEISGLSSRNPYISFVFALGLLSLLGMPPLAGFAGKVYLFFAALDANLLWLGLALVVNSGISAGYYGLLVKRIFIDEPSEKIAKIRTPAYVSLALGLPTLILIALGVYPGLAETFARAAAGKALIS